MDTFQFKIIMRLLFLIAKGIISLVPRNGGNGFDKLSKELELCKRDYSAYLAEKKI